MRLRRPPLFGAQRSREAGAGRGGAGLRTGPLGRRARRAAAFPRRPRRKEARPRAALTAREPGGPRQAARLHLPAILTDALLRELFSPARVKPEPVKSRFPHLYLPSVSSSPILSWDEDAHHTQSSQGTRKRHCHLGVGWGKRGGRRAAPPHLYSPSDIKDASGAALIHRPGRRRGTSEHRSVCRTWSGLIYSQSNPGAVGGGGSGEGSSQWHGQTPSRPTSGKTALLPSAECLPLCSGDLALSLEEKMHPLSTYFVI